MEAIVSKIKDKWSGEFENLSYFSKDIIQKWIMDYINLNNNIFVIDCESRDELIELEKKFMKWKLKKR